MQEVSRPIIAENRARPVPPSTRSRSVQPSASTFFCIIPAKHIVLGDVVYPFAGIVIFNANTITGARWRVNGGGWTAFAVGANTDLIQSIKLFRQTINVFDGYHYDVELTDSAAVVKVFSVDVSCRMVGAEASRSVHINKPLRIFSEVHIAKDPTQINSIKYQIIGPSAVAPTVIARNVFFTGTHTGAGGASILTDTTKNFTNLGLIINKDIVKNTTDGSQGVITSHTITTLTATLAGGVDNDWDASDAYQIIDGMALDIIAKNFVYTFTVAGVYIARLIVEDLSLNTSVVDIPVFVSST